MIYTSWDTAPPTAIECPGCKRITDEWSRYYDRHHIYSGRACSDECARTLPGQGEMWDYEAEESLEDDAPPIIDGCRCSSCVRGEGS